MYFRSIEQSAKIVKTADGTDTLYLPLLDEHYHSLHGARQESQHVYIEEGLRYWWSRKKDISVINVLEVGFGTGLNAMLTYNFALENKVKINYCTLEPYPLPLEITDQLHFNFSTNEKELFDGLHACEWGVSVDFGDFFNFSKHSVKLEDFETNRQFDVVFFDAFAPSKQKNIWSSGNLSKLHTVMGLPDSVLSTYCSQGNFKRISKEAGFEVEVTNGPPGKREMVRLIRLSIKK